jgi:hypothetical protein
VVGRGKAMMVAAASDRGSPRQRGGAATETAKAHQLRTRPERCSGVRTEPVRAPDRGGRSGDFMHVHAAMGGRRPARPIGARRVAA